MIAAPQSSVPHPCEFFLSQGWEATAPNRARTPSIQMKNFLHPGPPLALFARWHRALHGLHNSPPLLRRLIGRHLRHVGGIVGPVVFKIGVKSVVLQVDRVVANVALANHLQHAWPNGGVVLLVLLFSLRLEADHHSVPSDSSLLRKFAIGAEARLGSRTACRCALILARPHHLRASSARPDNFL